MEKIYYWYGFGCFWISCLIFVLACIYYCPEKLYKIKISRKAFYYFGYNIIWNPYLFPDENGKVNHFMESPAIKYFVVKKWKGIYLAYRRKDIEVTGYWTTDN